MAPAKASDVVLHVAIDAREVETLCTSVLTLTDLLQVAADPTIGAAADRQRHPRQRGVLTHGHDHRPTLKGMRIDRFEFGTIRIDGKTYGRDIVVDRGAIRSRKKKPSKQFRDEYSHTPLSMQERIPWKCSRLVVGTGAQGALPVMPAVLEEAKRRGVQVVAC